MGRLVRVISTGICFVAFGVGGLLLALIVFPGQRLITRNEQERKALARLTVHRSFRFFVNIMSLTGVLRTEIQGKSLLKQASGKVIIANHPSLIDVVIIIANVPNADCVVKSALFSNPFIKGVLNNVGYIRNDNPEQLIVDCKASLDQGNNIIIFPEGTRTTPGEQIKFKRGAAQIAVRCGANYLPLLIKVSPTTLTKSEPWYRVPARKVHFYMQVLSELNLSNYWTAEIHSVSVRELTRFTEEYYLQELYINEHYFEH